MKWLTWIVAVLAIVSATDSRGEELPASYFSRLPAYESPRLSPQGNRLAFITNVESPAVSVLTTLDMQTGEQHYLVKSDNEKVILNWFRWANNKTLLVSARYATKRYRTEVTETRLFAVEFDKPTTEEPRILIKPRTSGLRDQHYSQFQDNIIDILEDDPEHILIAVDLDRANLPSLYRLNIYSGRKNRIHKGKMNIRDYLTDQQGRMRIGYAQDFNTGINTVYLRNQEDDGWDPLFKHNALEESGKFPVGFANDPNQLYYRAYNGDKLALFKMDLVSGESELVYADDNYDVNGRLIYSPKLKDYIGVRHSSAKGGRVYWNKALQSLQNGVEKIFPDQHAYLIDFSADENRYILYAESDSEPGIYYLGDRQQGQLQVLFQQYPEIPLDTLSDHKLITYTARDGQKIEAYLTLPSEGEGPFPTILNPHGGPGARDYSGFNYWAAFFNSRGYAVLRPNFRGSQGYGKSFAESQMQSWGLEMQDDLTDATHWLIDSGIADPNKVCIVGASYGGYAAAMAAVKTPDLFKCAISFAGVHNLKDLVRGGKNFLNYKFIKAQIGDDYSDLKQRSPYYHAEKVKIPMLLMHGSLDRVVSVEQSREFADELLDYDKDVKYVELDNGTHYLDIQRNRHALFAEMDSFLKQHLRPALSASN